MQTKKYRFHLFYDSRSLYLLPITMITTIANNE